MKFSEILEYYKSHGLSELYEAISPIEIEYGANFKNKKWMRLDDSSIIKQKAKTIPSGKMIYTYCEIDKTIYQVYIINNNDSWSEIGFASSNNFDKKNPESLENLTKFNWKRVGGSNAISIFNRIFYIVLEGLKKYNVQKLAFKGLDPELGAIYSKLMKQKSLPSILEKNGYSYRGENSEGYFLFTKN